MAEEKVHVSYKQTRNEFQDKLDAEQLRHNAALEIESAYHRHRVTDLEGIIAKFNKRIKE